MTRVANGSSYSEDSVLARAATIRSRKVIPGNGMARAGSRWRISASERAIITSWSTTRHAEKRSCMAGRRLWRADVEPLVVNGHVGMGWEPLDENHNARAGRPRSFCHVV